MPIITEKAQYIEFQYNPETEEGVSVWVRYHTTEWGPTISLALSEDKEDWIDFPASLFSEVVDHLRNQHGELGGVREQQIKKNPKPQLFKSKPKLSSFIQQQVKNEEESQEQTEDDFHPVEVADINPVESLSSLAKGNITNKDGSSQGKNLARMIGTRNNVQQSKSTSIPIKKGYRGDPVIVINENKPGATQQSQNVEHRPVMKIDKELVNQMSDEELKDAYSNLRQYNSAKAVTRLE